MEVTDPVHSLPKPPRAADVHTAEGRYRSGMLRRFGLLYHLSGLGLFLRRLRLEEHSADNIRRAAELGPVVYVLHTSSRIDWLAVNRVLNARRLPLARYTTGQHSTVFRPLIAAVREVFEVLKERIKGQSVEDPVRSGWFTKAVASGVTSCIFLVQKHLASTSRGRQGDRLADPVAALLEAQRVCERPIQVVPIVVIWRRNPEQARSQVARMLLGSQDEPNSFQKLFALTTRNSRALVQAGQPLDLKEYLERTADDPPQRQARAARILLRRYLYRESHTIRGPRIRPYRWMRRLVLGSPEVRELVRDEALVQKRKSETEVREDAERTLDKLAARLSFPILQVVAFFCGILFNRIFAGVDIRPEDVERMRDAIRKGTPILVPCHRSHLDYLLISYLMYSHDLIIPHIVAGDNLNFFPMGPVFRRCGAFFVKRTISGDRVFKVVFDRYLRQLVRDGYPVEFFIEGGRSRTGKLLPAKHGVLRMVIDAAAAGREDREVTFLPIGISYEQVAEEAAYRRELAGAQKKKENLSQMMRASRVIRKRYGKVYLRVGEPMPAREVLHNNGESWESLDREHRLERLQWVGERLMYRIGESMVVLPTGLVSMALLAQSRRGIRLTELHERVQRLDVLLSSCGAVPAASLTHGGWSVQQALSRFEDSKLVRRFRDEQGDILQVVGDQRVTLEYYKNGLIHFVVPISLMAGAVRAQRGREILDTDELFRVFRMLVFMLRYEFTLNPEVPLEELQEQALAQMVDYGALSRVEDGGLRLANPKRAAELYHLTRNFLESYFLVLRAARTLRSRDIKLADLPKRIQDVGQGLLAVDEITRPEALSMANLKNGVRAFREEGVIQTRSGGGGLQFDEAAYGEYAADFLGLLG